MLPIAVLALPVLFVVCLISRVNPFEAIATFWHIFAALKTRTSKWTIATRLS